MVPRLNEKAARQQIRHARRRIQVRRDVQKRVCQPAAAREGHWQVMFVQETRKLSHIISCDSEPNVVDYTAALVFGQARRGTPRGRLVLLPKVHCDVARCAIRSAQHPRNVQLAHRRGHVEDVQPFAAPLQQAADCDVVLTSRVAFGKQRLDGALEPLLFLQQR